MSEEELSFPPSSFEQRDFFVPAATSADESLEAWKAFATEAVDPPTDRKVQRLVYNHRGKRHVSEVGYLENDDMANWLVTAIFEPVDSFDHWSICIVRFPNGKLVSRNPPIMVPRSEVEEALDFSQPEITSAGT